MKTIYRLCVLYFAGIIYFALAYAALVIVDPIQHFQFSTIEREPEFQQILGDLFSELTPHIRKELKKGFIDDPVKVAEVGLFSYDLWPIDDGLILNNVVLNYHTDESNGFAGYSRYIGQDLGTCVLSLDRNSYYPVVSFGCDGFQSDSTIQLLTESDRDTYAKHIEKITKAYSGDLGSVFLRSLYLSAVAASSLGFGDIVPVTTKARVFVTVETTFGVILLGLIVGRAAIFFDNRREVAG